jgi:hypothetical protein
MRSDVVPAHDDVMMDTGDRGSLPYVRHVLPVARRSNRFG